MSRSGTGLQAKEKGRGGACDRKGSERLDSVGSGFIRMFVHGRKRSKDRSFCGAHTRQVEFSPDDQTFSKEIHG